MQFQFLSEFIFGAPTPPAIGVNGDGIIFNNDHCCEEKFKINVSEDICRGVMEKARQLHSENKIITPSQWHSHANQFMRRLTFEDNCELSMAKNAGDVRQLNFHSVVWKPADEERTILYISGKKILNIVHYIYKGRYLSVLMLFNLIPLMIKWHKSWDENVICDSAGPT